MAVITVSTSIFRGIAYGIGLLAATIVTAAGLFYFFGIFVEIFPLVTVSIFAGLSAYLWKFVEERQSKNEIRSMFSKYVSSDVADELIRKGIDKLELGGQEREVTLFFSDIVGFTDLSEKLTPADLGKVMNAYFEEMSTIILQRRGTIDKFIGDAVMAFWNAPTEQANHAELACESAVLQRQALAKVHGFVHSIDAGMSIDMRIGIHT
jgi:adenylate cyclase